MTELIHPLECIRDGKNKYYGGAQAWSESKTFRGYGCGVIAVAHIALHEKNQSVWNEHVAEKRNSKIIEKDEFMELVNSLRKRYLFVIPKFGLNGIFLTIGSNFYFRKAGLGLRARWGCMPWNIWKRIDRMLEADIPVLLAIGPNFPFLFGKRKLNLYGKKNGVYQKETETIAHYVTVTASDEAWLEISSWGRRYYINKLEYKKYVSRHSAWLFSNIMVVKRK